ECRLKQARELAQFAALYSDRVFLNNHFGTLGRYLNNSIDEARFEFHDDLEVMLLFRPLIEAGLIVPITPSTTHCYHCLGRKALNGGERKQFDSSLRRFA